MVFFLTLEGDEKGVRLSAEAAEGEEVSLCTTPLAFVPWSIVFRDFLRLLYWFPHSQSVVESTLNVLQEAFVFPDEVGAETCFRLQPLTVGKGLSASLQVWQPASEGKFEGKFEGRAVFSIHGEATLSFLNVLALGLIRKGSEDFTASADEVEEEELFQFHAEVRRIEDEFRATGLSPFWVTPDVQRLLAVGRAYDLGLPLPDGIPRPLLVAAEEKVLGAWSKSDMESLFAFIADLEQQWRAQFMQSPKDSGEAILSLENWAFALNLFGFVDRFLTGVLPTRLPNPTAPLLAFLLERFFITQWESNLWPARRSALVESYRHLVPFLVG